MRTALQVDHAACSAACRVLHHPALSTWNSFRLRSNAQRRADWLGRRRRRYAHSCPRKQDAVDFMADSTHASTLLVYGQRTSQFDAMAPSTLRFCVARRKPPPPPPSERKIRPGEPLPRGSSINGLLRFSLNPAFSQFPYSFLLKR